MNNKIWTIEEIKKEIKKLDKIFGKNGFEIPIKINTRMTRSLGMYKFKIENKKITPISFEFSKKILSGMYKKEFVIGVIRHEYAHYVANDIHKEPCGHDKRFKNICELINAPSSAVLK